VRLCRHSDDSRNHGRLVDRAAPDCVRCLCGFSSLPSDLQGAIWQSGKASADFVNSGGMRGIVRFQLIVHTDNLIQSHPPVNFVHSQLKYHGTVSIFEFHP
jgi:hypothetical protein